MKRPDPLIPCKPGAEDTACMNNRQKWMESLFILDGRNQPEHPMKGLFTGLAQKYALLESTDD
jgi:hypothetical protein